MKFTVFLIFLSLIPNSSEDEVRCAASSIYFYPEQKEIPVNSHFIAEGYLMSQEKVRKFKHRKVFLRSTEGDSISLELLELLEGEMSLTQAVFKPQKTLDPNTEYFLEYENMTLEEEKAQVRRNYETGKSERKSWKTVSNIASLDPALTVSFKETSVKWYGCGPAVNAIFTVENDNSEETWYKTEFLDVKTGRISHFYLTKWQDELQVGHGMCAGAFTYRKNGEYRVRFTPVNFGGHALPTTKWHSFRSPFEGEENPWGF